MRCLHIPVLNQALLGTFAFLPLLQIPIPWWRCWEGRDAATEGWRHQGSGLHPARSKGLDAVVPPGPRQLPWRCCRASGSRGGRWPSLRSPNSQLSTETACDRQVKEERCIKAALILQGEDMSADSYLGTLRYQNP